MLGEVQLNLSTRSDFGYNFTVTGTSHQHLQEPKNQTTRRLPTPGNSYVTGNIHKGEGSTLWQTRLNCYANILLSISCHRRELPTRGGPLTWGCARA